MQAMMTIMHNERTSFLNRVLQLELLKLRYPFNKTRSLALDLVCVDLSIVRTRGLISNAESSKNSSQHQASFTSKFYVSDQTLEFRKNMAALLTPSIIQKNSSQHQASFTSMFDVSDQTLGFRKNMAALLTPSNYQKIAVNIRLHL